MNKHLLTIAILYIISALDAFSIEFNNLNQMVEFSIETFVDLMKSKINNNPISNDEEHRANIQKYMVGDSLLFVVDKEQLPCGYEFPQIKNVKYIDFRELIFGKNDGLDELRKLGETRWLTTLKVDYDISMRDADISIEIEDVYTRLILKSEEDRYPLEMLDSFQIYRDTTAWFGLEKLQGVVRIPLIPNHVGYYQFYNLTDEYSGYTLTEKSKGKAIEGLDSKFYEPSLLSADFKLDCSNNKWVLVNLGMMYYNSEWVAYKQY